MEKLAQVLVDLQFQGRLRKESDLGKAEVLFFIDLLQEYGSIALDVPGYSVRQPTESGLEGKPIWPCLLKIRGEWTPLWLLMIEDDIAVLCDRRPG
ncbi:MAG: hypothetical protein H6917_13325 [Novosphingobium sp.]|nr:hypothetical protein [Novosphingobium sp.]MCP5403351.1 hypothetical protein [Novosphingobium sp.]